VELDEDRDGGGDGAGIAAVEVGFEGRGPVLGGEEDGFVKEGREGGGREDDGLCG
jgi:hypothetical protein